MKIQFYSFAYLYPSFPASFVEKTVLSPIKWSWHHSQKKNLIMYVEVYFWVIHIIPLIYISVFIPAPDCSFIVSLEIKNCVTSYVLFQDCFGYSKSLEIPYEF